LKFVFPSNSGRLGARLVALCVAAAVSQAVLASELKFEQEFSDKGEAAALYYEAVFTSKGVDHHLDVWRDGERRLKRRTDDSIETFVFRKPGDAEFQMSILDLKKHIHTRIDRSNLYRIGNFTDWFDLAHGLKHPKGEYRLAKIAAPESAPKTVDACQWYALTQEERTTRLCWSAQSRLPLLLLAQDDKVMWRVTSVERKPIAAQVFVIHDEGFVRNDANQDIERD
jgi:hypothetical protein